MTRHPTTVPMHCPTCGATVCLPVTQTLSFDDETRILVDGTAMETHMVVCEAEKIINNGYEGDE